MLLSFIALLISPLFKALIKIPTALEKVAKLQADLDNSKLDIQKQIQSADSKGFERANLKLTEQFATYVAPEDVALQLKAVEDSNKLANRLNQVGIAKLDTALKVLSDKDKQAILADDFDAKTFKETFKQDLVFNTIDTKQAKHTPIVPADNNAEMPLTADSFSKLSKVAQSKLSADDLINLL